MTEARTRRMSYPTEVKAVGLSFRHVTAKLKRGDRVKLVPEPDNKFDPNALAIQTLDGEMLGYVGKKDPLRLRMLESAKKDEVTLPVLIANYYEKDQDKLWDSVEVGDMVQLWLRALSLTPVNDTSFVEVESFTGEKVLWSEYLHICTDLQGNELMGGSTYASIGKTEFDSERIAKAFAKKNELDTGDVIDYWNDLKLISMDYGTAIHRAMELYNKHYKKIGHKEALPRVPHLREAVKAFLLVSDFGDCIAEPLITDTKMGMSGWIDNLRFVGDKTVIIEDYKTNTFKDTNAYHAKWGDNLKTYKRQMNYYGTILENFGYEVVGTTVWHWHRDRWKKHELGFTSVKEYKR